MKTLLLILACTTALMAQSFPGAVYTPLVAKDNIQTALTSPMLIGDAVAIVASSTGWVPQMAAYICDATTGTGAAAKCTSFEVLLVTNVATNVLSVTRGYGGTVAAAHASGKGVLNAPAAVYTTSVNNETKAIETALGANLANIPGSPSGGIVPVAKGGTGLAVAQGAGTGTKVQLAAGSPTTGNVPKFDSSGALIDSGVTPSTIPAGTAPFQRFVSGLAPTFAGIFKDAPTVSSADYNFSPQVIGGTVLAGGAVVAGLAPCPLGVAGTDTLHYLYLSGGVGTAEAVLLTVGGSCTSGAASGTVNFIAANAHSGSWTIGSATSGIQEAIRAAAVSSTNPYGSVAVVVPAGRWPMYAPVQFPGGSQAVTVMGAGRGVSTLLRDATFTAGSMFMLGGPAINAGAPYVIRDLYLESPQTLQVTTGSFIDVWPNSICPLIVNIEMHNGYDGITVHQSSALIDLVSYQQDGQMVANSKSSRYGLNITSSLSVGSSGVRVTNSSFVASTVNSLAYSLAAGIHIDSSDGITILNTWANGYNGMLLQNLPACHINDLWMDGMVIDNVGQYGIYAAGLPPTGFQGNITLSNSHIAGYVQAPDVRVSGIVWDMATTGVRFLNNEISGFPTGYGIQIPATGAKTGLQVIGNQISGVLTGIGWGTTIANSIVSENVIGPVSGPVTNGIITTGNLTSTKISGNNFVGVLTYPIYLTPGSTYVNSGISDNLGYNPVGLSAISVTASPFTYTAGPSPETIYITGGTVSAIKRGATTVAAASPAQITVPALGTVQVTYTVAPTMVKDVQ